MKKLTHLIAATLIFTAPALFADEPLYVSSFGDEYRFEENDDGVVFRSVYPKAWFIENGANSRVERGIDVLYFGKSCDTFHKVFGTGKWWWANGGFGAEFDTFRITFPRQEIDVDFGFDCRL